MPMKLPHILFTAIFRKLFPFFLQNILSGWYPTSNTFLSYGNYHFGRKRTPLFRCFQNKFAAGWQKVCPDLTPTKTIAAKTLYPNKQRGKCHLLLLSNVAQAEVLNIKCTKKLLSGFHCMKCRKSHLPGQNKTLSDLQKSCPTGFVQINQECFSYFWWKVSVNDKQSMDNLVKKGHFLGEQNEKHLRHVSLLLHATSLKRLSILILPRTENNTIILHSSMELINIINVYHSFAKILTEETQGFLIQMVQKRQFHLESRMNLFQCTNGSFIISDKVCNDHHDCPNDKSDEENCTCDSQHVQTQTYTCKIITHNSTSHKCGLFHFRTRNHKCKPFTQRPKLAHVPDIFCGNDQKVQHDLWNDLIPDCNDQTDEFELISLLITNVPISCLNPNQFPCHPGHSRCYNVEDLCVFKLDELGHLAPCRNGGHVQKCKDAEYNARFKCSRAFCIPWTFVCDGKIDCPGEDDEETSNMGEHICKYLYFCAFMFKCMHQNSCVHLHNVCDGFSDCLFEDDEFLCELINHPCPKDCKCFIFAVLCQHSKFYLVRQTYLHRSVQVQNSSILNFPDFSKLFQKAIKFSLSDNDIENVCIHALPRDIVFLEIKKNPIFKITSNCLGSLDSLQYISLTDNQIFTIEPYSFVKLKHVLILKLSNNPIKRFPENIFAGLAFLKSVFLKNINANNVSSKMFEKANSVPNIVTHRFYLCCAVPSSSCFPQPKWFESCSQLLPGNGELLLFRKEISCSILCANISSIVMQAFVIAEKNAFSCTVISINSTDMLMSLYLGIIWIANLVMAKNFFLLQEKWRHSYICFTATFSILYFTILIELLLLFLSLSRLMVVVQPMQTRFKVPKFAMSAVATLLISSFAASAIILFQKSMSSGAVSHNLCLPFVDYTKSLSVSVLVYSITVSQTVASITIFVFHVSLIHNVKKSKSTVGASNQSKDSFTALVALLIIVTFSNILCWYPSNVIYLLTLILDQYPTEMVTWTTVVFTPINSVINPIIVLLFSARKHFRKKQAKPLDPGIFRSATSHHQHCDDKTW